MNAPPVGGLVNINVSAVFQAFSILMKATLVLNGWDAGMVFETPLKNAMTGILRIMMAALLTVK